MEQSNAEGADEPDILEEARVRARVAEVISSHGGVKEIARITGIPAGTLEKYSAQSSTPSLLNAAKIAIGTGVGLDDLAFFDEDASKTGVIERLRNLSQRLADKGWLGVTLDHHDPTFIRLPIFTEVNASAGPGALPSAEMADGVVAFDRRFLTQRGATPERCTVIIARGDSMVPTIPDGSLLIVDHSQREVKNGCIMVINVGDDLLVKRIRRRLDGLIELISDNSAYPPETLGPDSLQQLRIVGRVIYFCRQP